MIDSKQNIIKYSIFGPARHISHINSVMRSFVGFSIEIYDIYCLIYYFVKWKRKSLQISIFQITSHGNKINGTFNQI